MGHWNHRIMRHNDDPTWYGLHEVYYNDAGQVVAWTDSPVTVTGESVDDLCGLVEFMQNDKTRPLLDYDMAPEGDWDIGDEEDETEPVANAVPTKTA